MPNVSSMAMRWLWKVRSARGSPLSFMALRSHWREISSSVMGPRRLIVSISHTYLLN